METIASDANKGGVGKTTIAFHVACYLRGAGKRTLFLGMDTNMGATRMFMKKRFNAQAVGKMNNRDLIEQPGADWHKAIIHFDASGEKLALMQHGMPRQVCASGGCLDIITESLELADIYESFTPSAYAATIAASLPYTVNKIKASGEYDYMIIDNAPGWGPLEKSVLLASQHVIIPVEAAPLSIDSLEEYAERVDTTNKQHRQAGSSACIDILGVLLSRVKDDIDLQHRLTSGLPAALARANLTTFYQDSAKQHILMIPETNAVLGASVTSLPAWSTEPDDPGSQALLTLGYNILHKLG